MDFSKTEMPGAATKPTGPKSTVTTFVLLCFLFSSVFWYLIAQLPSNGKGNGRQAWYTIGVMWCPAIAAVLTRLWFQRNLRGFGFPLGKARWLLVGMLSPMVLGLVMFGSAWIFGVAPVDPSGVTQIFSFSFIPFFLFQIVINCAAAFGEELD